MSFSLLLYKSYRVQTAYVTVEPKRKRQVPSPQQGQTATIPATSDVSELAQTELEPTHVETNPQLPVSGGKPRPSASGRELRRARIIITVKRTESYKKWLEENPLQAIITGEGDDEDDDIDDHSIHPVEASSS